MKILFINLINLFALVGFFISLYIYNQKRKREKLICPRKTDCDKVVYSTYSRFLGFPVEVLGMIYYFLIGSIYSYLSIFELWSTLSYCFILFITSCSIIFSVYLLSIQAFIIKKWCLWCLSSAFISSVIFILSYIFITTKF